MTKPLINGFNSVAPLLVQQYERYLPTAFDESMTLLEKVNKIIQYCNSLGLTQTDVITQWNEVMEWVMADGLNESINAKLDAMVLDGTLEDIININIFNDMNTRMDGEGINIMFPPAPLVGAKTDGTDQANVIQAIIDYANTSGIRKVFVPTGTYSISKSILLNGCSMYGVQVNQYNMANMGSRFDALAQGFSGIKQGSLSANGLQFNVFDIMVTNATTGFEFIYVINSTFERLYAKSCVTGFQIGNSASVGAMFCSFNHFWTDSCQYGLTVYSKDYFNNNEFYNGFLQGDVYGASVKVDGGYGAVGLTFNNVEFKSALGRGIILDSVVNTAFNNCYFETGGNAVRFNSYCDISLNDCTYGVSKKANSYGDNSFVYVPSGGRISLDGGIVFLSSENDDTYFYQTGNDATYANVDLKSNISLNGTANNFVKWAKAVNEIKYKTEEQVKSSSSQVVPFGGYKDFTIVWDTPFTAIPDFCTYTLVGNNYDGNNISSIRYENLKEQMSVRVYNNSPNTDRTVTVRGYAKRL
jgi:hypothetical protein